MRTFQLLLGPIKKVFRKVVRTLVQGPSKRPFCLLTVCRELNLPSIDAICTSSKYRALLKYPNLKTWAKEQNVEWENEAELAKLPAVEKLLRGEVEKLTQNLADFEKIRRIAVLEREFSVQEGELTPTLKVKRNVVAETFGDLIAD